MMIAFLATIATIGAIASVLRLWLAYLDYQRRWCKMPSNITQRKGSR